MHLQQNDEYQFLNFCVRDGWNKYKESNFKEVFSTVELINSLFYLFPHILEVIQYHQYYYGIHCTAGYLFFMQQHILVTRIFRLQG